MTREKMAAGLKEALSQADGFIRSERFSSLTVEGKLLRVSIWKDETSVERWRNLAAHRMYQKHGRLHDFVDYTVTVVTPKRTCSMTRRKEAPDDSNRFWEV